MTDNGKKEGEANFKAGVFQDYFGTRKYRFAQEIDRIDFIIMNKADRHIFWAETKKNTADIIEMFVQLILTIGKGRTFDKYMPPPFLGVFDYEKIAFLPYNAISETFYKSDFNWNIAPSDYKTKEFTQIKNIVDKIITKEKFVFSFDTEKTELKEFIKNNFTETLDLFPDLVTHIQIDKNNFFTIYNRWTQTVKPSIAIDWNTAKKRGIIDGDFYLADLLSEDNQTIKDKLYVLLQTNKYELDRHLDEMGLIDSKTVPFRDGGKAHKEFWDKYTRPPKKEYWEYIVKRRDLLVPQDIRERKGSFYTPQIWVEKSQEYLTKVFGENWQDEYYIWDCAAGSGNLLIGLTNKYNIWASTLDKQDISVIADRINNGANLLWQHIFQFDFLNDDFDKLPDGLQEIINDPEKRKKLIIYINPPYAEGDNRRGVGRSGVAISSMQNKYALSLGYSKRELYLQFFARVYHEIQGCKLGEFSTLTGLTGVKFIDFRNFFKATLLKCFIVRANTFDNVSGEFPIGFKIWDTEIKEAFHQTTADVFEDDGTSNGTKTIFAYNNEKFINDWTIEFISEKPDSIANIIGVANDFQHQNTVCIERPNKPWNHQYQWQITKENIIESCVYYSVRKCIDHTWINHNDQFLFPNDNWKQDNIFQINCLVYTIFGNKNFLSCKHGANHWIPFTAQEIDANDNFESSFMSDFLKNKQFSPEAASVMEAGRKLYQYYHTKAKADNDAPLNASYYDIREYFQGRADNGKMNNKSADETYNVHIKTLRDSLKMLAEKITPKVYQYGFLKE